MKEKILEELKEIERQEGIRIIHCVESGSRAWGFASPDSDFDVRFIYVRKPEFYLRLDKTRDVIEWRLDDVLDINGWDLQKALRLLHTSNPTLFEWNNSPIVYKTTNEWTQIGKIIENYFLAKSGLYHYLSTAKSNYREYLKSDEVKLKKYFYVIRPLYACKWILKYGTPPPMEFSRLHKEFADDDIRQAIDELLEVKINSPEIKLGKRIDVINSYIERTIPEIEQVLNELPEQRKSGWNELNKVFSEIVYRNNLHNTCFAE